MSSHVFSLLFKVVLNSTLSWWKTICFLGLVLLWLNVGLGKHQHWGTGAGWEEEGAGQLAGSGLTVLDELSSKWGCPAQHLSSSGVVQLSGYSSWGSQAFGWLGGVEFGMQLHSHLMAVAQTPHE